MRVGAGSRRRQIRPSASPYEIIKRRAEWSFARGPSDPQGPGLGYNNTGAFFFFFCARTRFCQAWREKRGLRKGFSLTSSLRFQVQQPRTAASPTARLFQHQTSPRLRSPVTSVVMLSAPPAACGQTRHFNYCALVDGDVRREAARTDRLYSPHHVPTSTRSHAETQSGQASVPTAVASSPVERLLV